ncbi:MAG TPA: plastocyanin/azurin family copper-binding protein [Gemmatimonadaceae bacterium]|jgi:plastocyanin|nr:plastocyanin/azurin family copper-binding protein [Gemmatimonadaceae bacterium]
MRATDDGYGYSTFSFNPASVTITRGGSVTWTHDGAAATHNVTFTGATSGTPANIGNISSGNASRTFNTAGSFSYHCTNHQSMTGTVVVQ